MTKNELRGFAGGLILATLILSYVYFFHTDNQEAAAPVEISETDVNDYALENNLVILTEEEYQQLNGEANAAEEQKESNQEEASNDEEKEVEEIINANLEITPGMSTQEVAQKLQELNLISNHSEFTNYIREQDLESAVKAGTFNLNSEMTIEEIVKIVTR